MSASALLQSLFKYKAWANEALFTELESLDPAGHEAERHLAIRLLNHVYVVDQIFAAHLAGKPHPYTRVNTDATPTQQELHRAQAASDRWYLEYIATLPPERLSERVPFTFTDGMKGCMSREEILAHVATHGGYHRGGIGRIATQLSTAPPTDTLTTYLHSVEPERRTAAT
ncbi:DinB family protein [Usitatibacter palustris]|uniref:Damage-inducible protein DinB n=1 Tax=Usitatibacter palustris TaxID=2732487 RepID=A0A6M4H9X7_9PROT|nr:DinB family protein [Usitatibacter palustris]QJR16062.1 hypothetical protein DSM104440_02890 [Usitatibacter palustris]